LRNSLKGEQRVTSKNFVGSRPSNSRPSIQETAFLAGIAGKHVNQPIWQEREHMSGVNGDKARFNRRRRQKISRRLSNGKMLKELAGKNLVAPAKAENLKEKSA
jgi:hypothetical protein